MGFSALAVSSRLIELHSRGMGHENDKHKIAFSVYCLCMHSLFPVHAAGEQDVDKKKDGVQVRDHLAVHR